MNDPFPWSGLWEWFGVWRTYGGYAGRRTHLEELAVPVRDALDAKRSAAGTGLRRLGQSNG